VNVSVPGLKENVTSAVQLVEDTTFPLSASTDVSLSVQLSGYQIQLK
jgi:hypothetical protein